MTNEQKVLKVKCENSLLFYARYIYKENHNRKFIMSPHFERLAEFLEAVHRGEITRGIINIPPRYGKTELVIKMFVSWCIAINNVSRFLHLSYSDALALDNSSQTKEYIQSEAYQTLWKMELKKDAQSKSKWFNEFGGGMYATSSGGAITGFGAGVADSEEFSGAILIDDPLKPDDAFSEVKRKAINNRYNNTIRSRVNGRNIPIIVIMQRLHEEDMSGFLLDGGSGEEWEHLCMPVLNEDNTPLWNDKHNFEEIEQIRQADRYTFSGQYMQTPSPDAGGEWKKEWFQIIKRQDLPNDIQWQVFVDGAYTKETRNDPTGLQASGKSGNNLYILSSIDKYLEMPELLKFLPTYIDSLGVDVGMTKVEPKASGKSLVQLVRQTTDLNISEIKSKFVSVSKIERARSSTPYLEGGRVFLVEGMWNEHFLHQVAMFPNGKHDEHIDLTAYSIEDNLLQVNDFELMR
jgi:predicted phage terminase large subunit-like protein